MAKKKGVRSPVLVHMPKHLYKGDGIRDHRGVDRCADCGLGREHPVHELPDVDRDAAALESRRLGEHGDQA